MSVQSMVSLGRVGRILAGSIDPSDMTVTKEAHGAGTSGTVSSSSSSTATSFQANPGYTATLHQLSSSSLSPAGGETSQARSDTSSIAGSTSKIIFHEPDVIASTKLASSKTTDSITQSQNVTAAPPVASATGVPVAPPRKRKKGRKVSTSSSDQVNDGLQLPITTDKVNHLVTYFCSFGPSSYSTHLFINCIP